MREAERFANGGEISGVVLDASGVSAWRGRRFAASALVVQDQLPIFRERRERWPEEVVVEQQSAVDAHERSRTGYLRREIDGEVETACANGTP